MREVSPASTSRMRHRAHGRLIFWMPIFLGTGKPEKGTIDFNSSTTDGYLGTCSKTGARLACARCQSKNLGGLVLVTTKTRRGEVL